MALGVDPDNSPFLIKTGDADRVVGLEPLPSLAQSHRFVRLFLKLSHLLPILLALLFRLIALIQAANASYSALRLAAWTVGVFESLLPIEMSVKIFERSGLFRSISPCSALKMRPAPPSGGGRRGDQWLEVDAIP